MKTILIPTDFSENAYNAIRYGIHLFDGTICRFILLNTYLPVAVDSEFGIYHPISVHLIDSAKEISEKNLKQISTQIKDEFPNCNHNFETLSSLNQLADELKYQVENRDIDLIIMGTKGAAGIKEIFFGSITRNVVKNIDNCPIIIIPKNQEYKPWRNIAFATNFDRPFKKWQIRPLTQLAALHSSTIRIIQIYDPPYLSDEQLKNFETLDTFLQGVEYHHHVMKEYDTIENAITAFAKELEIDVLTLINYKHGFLDRLTREPVVKKITLHSTIPLIILPENNQEQSIK